MRLISTYSEAQALAIKEKAKELGLTPSHFQRYITLLALNMVDLDAPSNNMTQLIQQMYDEIDNRKSGDFFIVATLFPSETWMQLSADEKRTLGRLLSTYADKHPELLQKEDKKYAETTNRYRKV